MALRPSSTLVILCLRCMGWSCQLKDHGLPVFGKSTWVHHHHSIESGFPLETSVPSNLQTMLLYLYLLKHLKFLYFFESWEHKTARYARYHHGILREIRTHCRKEKTEIRKDFSQHREPHRAIYLRKAATKRCTWWLWLYAFKSQTRTFNRAQLCTLH